VGKIMQGLLAKAGLAKGVCTGAWSGNAAAPYGRHFGVMNINSKVRGFGLTEPRVGAIVCPLECGHCR
jgi:hypothetical protein